MCQTFKEIGTLTGNKELLLGFLKHNHHIVVFKKESLSFKISTEVFTDTDNSKHWLQNTLAWGVGRLHVLRLSNEHIRSLY